MLPRRKRNEGDGLARKVREREGYAVSKELTHSTAFCNAQFPNDQNETEICNIKSLINRSNLTLMIHKVLSNSAVPLSSHEQYWLSVHCSAEKKKAGNGRQVTCLHAASTAQLLLAFITSGRGNKQNLPTWSCLFRHPFWIHPFSGPVRKKSIQKDLTFH